MIRYRVTYTDGSTAAGESVLTFDELVEQKLAEPWVREFMVLHADGTPTGVGFVRMEVGA